MRPPPERYPYMFVTSARTRESVREVFEHVTRHGQCMCRRPVCLCIYASALICDNFVCCMLNSCSRHFILYNERRDYSFFIKRSATLYRGGE